MVKTWPFQGVKWPPTRGWKGHFESPSKDYIVFSKGLSLVFQINTSWGERSKYSRLVFGSLWAKLNQQFPGDVYSFNGRMVVSCRFFRWYPEPWTTIYKLNGCFHWMIPNLYIENGCFTKHPFILGFQVFLFQIWGLHFCGHQWIVDLLQCDPVLSKRGNFSRKMNSTAFPEEGCEVHHQR